MAETIEQLEQAAQLFLDEGRVDDARLIADQIVKVQREDPLFGVPTEIGGLELDDTGRNLFLQAQQTEDPVERAELQARITGRLAARDPNNIAASGPAAALRGVGTGILGVGDVAAAAGTALRDAVSGNALTPSQEFAAQQELRRSLEEQFPVASGAGELVGAVGTGFGLAKGVQVAAKGAPSIKALTKFVPGQTGRNILRFLGISAGAGALEAGITEEVTEGEGARGAQFGAAFGLGGAALIKGFAVAGRALLKTPAGKSLKIMASKLGVSAEEMAQRFVEFKAALGRPPSIVEIADAQAAASLRQTIIDSAGAVAVAREGAEAIERGAAREIAGQVKGGRVTTTQSAQKAERNVVAERQFAEAENEQIKFTAREVTDLLSDQDLRRALPPTLKRRLNEAMDVPEGSSVTLSGLDVNDLRLALRDRAKGATGADRVFGELANEVEDIARRQSAKFGKAIDEFAERSRVGEAVAKGRKVTSDKTEEFEETARQVTGAPERTALGTGARSGVVDVAREGAGQARGLMRDLSEESGLVQRLRAVLPAIEVDEFVKIARLQDRAAQNRALFVPGTQSVDKSMSEEVIKKVMEGGVVALGRGSGGFIVSFAAGTRRLIKGVSNKVAKQIARDAMDPAKTEKIISILRKARVPETDIVDLFVTATAAAGGQQAAAAVGEKRGLTARPRSVPREGRNQVAVVSDKIVRSPQKIMEQHRDLNFVQRAFDPNTPSIQNADGTSSTHKMVAGSDENGNWFAFPTIVQLKDGRLHEFGDTVEEEIKAMDFALDNNEFIAFGKKSAAAKKFASGGREGYKKGLPHFFAQE